MEELSARIENKEAIAKAKALTAELTSVEEALYQTKNSDTGINGQLKILDAIFTKDVPAFNKFVKDQEIPAVSIKTTGAP